MEVSWRSRKKIWYKDLFYSCCGRAVCSLGVNFAARCPRAAGAQPSSFHPGTLRRVTAGRYGGGVHPRGGPNSHVPVCGEPEWSCCGEPASKEGCVDSIFDHFWHF